MNAFVTFASGQNDWYAGQNAAEDRSGFERAFRRARRHSRVVRLLRYGLPFCVVAMGGVYALLSWLNPLAGVSMPGMGKLVVSGTRITMEVPRLGGYTRDGRAYELTAAAAAQDLKNPQVIELKELRAKFEVQGGQVVNLTADLGIYDMKSEAVILRDNVLVKTTTGTEMRMNEASVDVRKGSVVSDKPVEVDLPSGHVRANGLEVVDGGALVIFRGGVKTSLSGTGTAVVAGNGENSGPGR